MVRHALTRRFINGEQLREALLIQQRLAAAGQPNDLLGILRAQALRPDQIPELTRVYQNALSPTPLEDSRPTGHGYRPLPEEPEIPSDVLADSHELMRRPPEDDPEPVKEFLRASGEDATLADSPLQQSLSATRSLTMPERIGEYRVICELARGAFGIVYRGHSLELDRPVAIKVLRDADIATDEEIERFQIEARAAARLRHPNIVGIHRVGRDQDRHYLVMDLVEGETLKTRIAREGRLDDGTAARLTERLSVALQYAHTHQILHRDLKPSNVLIDKHDEPFITDFGLAKDVREGARELTVTGDVMGTPAYMPPEQAAGDSDHIDRRSDVYSLGATLYDMLTGARPFSGPTALGIMDAVLNEEPPTPRSLCPEVSRDLETICLKCLEKEPEARYGSADLLGDDLRRFLAGEPILARPLSPLGRGWRWVKRNRAISAAGALLVALVMGGGGGFVLWQAAVEQERRAQAIQREQALRDEVGALLDSIEGNSERTSEDVRRVYYALIQHSEPAAIEIMISRLDNVSEMLQGVVRDTYLEATDLSEDEVKAGHTALRDLPSAVDALVALTPGESVSETATETLGRAALVIEVRERARFRANNLSRRPTIKALIASRQGALAGPIAAARVLSHALGQIEHPGAVECLARHLAAERDPTRAIAAGQSLTRLGGARAQSLLLWSRDLHGRSSFYWRSVKRGLKSIDESLDQSLGAASNHVERAEAQYDKGEFRACETSASGAIGLDDSDARAWTLRGKARYQLKDYEGARTDAQRSVQLDPEDTQGWAFLGLAHDKLGKRDSAKTAYTRGLEMAPDDPLLLRLRASVLTDLHDWSAALSDANRAIELRPTDDRAWGTRGRLHHARRHFDAAESDYRRAIDVNPDSYSAWLNLATTRWALGDFAQAESDAGRALDLAQGNSEHAAEVLTNRAVFHQAQGNYEAALRDLDDALIRAPNNANALATRGSLRGVLGRTESAIADLTRALDLSPTLVDAWMNRGLFRARKGDGRGARADLDEAIRRDPNLSHAIAQRGLLRMAAGDRDGAVRDLDEAARVGPLNPTVWLSYGRLHAFYGDLPRAVKNYSRGLKLEPNNLTLLEGRADAYERQGARAAAVSDYNKALSIAPRNAPILDRRARLYASAGDLQSALKDYDTIVLLASDDPSAWLARAAVRGLLGDAKGAALDAENATRLAPKTPFVWQSRAVLESQWGKHGAALVSIENALTFDAGKDPKLWLSRGQIRERAGDLASALEDYERFLKLAPRSPEAVKLRARVRDLRRRE